MDKETRKLRRLLKKYIYELNLVSCELLNAEQIVPERGGILSSERKEKIVKLLIEGCNALNIRYNLPDEKE